MYEDCELTTYPIDCFEIARRLNYKLIPYSRLSGKKLIAAMQISTDGFHVLVEEKATGMFRWVIFYNDACCWERQRWTILHEIGTSVWTIRRKAIWQKLKRTFSQNTVSPRPLWYISHTAKIMLISQINSICPCRLHITLWFIIRNGSSMDRLISRQTKYGC